MKIDNMTCQTLFDAIKSTSNGNKQLYMCNLEKKKEWKSMSKASILGNQKKQK